MVMAHTCEISFGDLNFTVRTLGGTSLPAPGLLVAALYWGSQPGTYRLNSLGL